MPLASVPTAMLAVRKTEMGWRVQLSADCPRCGTYSGALTVPDPHITHGTGEELAKEPFVTVEACYVETRCAKVSCSHAYRVRL